MVDGPVLPAGSTVVARGPAPPELGAAVPPGAARGLVDRVRAAADAPLFAVVVGPGGTGKTMTLDALAAQYARADVAVVRGSAADPEPLRRLDPGRPVLVDDAHRLAPDVLDDLGGFARSAPVRLVVAYRPWPRPPALARLSAAVSGPRTVVVVGHLGPAAVAERVAARVGGRAPESMTQLVHEWSGGLPALVDLVTQALVDTGRFNPRRRERFVPPDRLTVSVTLAERLRPRVDSLDPTIHDLLEAMALGAPLDSEVLGPLLGVHGDQLDAAVEAARASGLLVESGDLIPIIRNLLQRLVTVLHGRELQRRLAAIELDRGGSVITAGRQLLGTDASGGRIAAVFEAAADEALDSAAPALAADFLAASVRAGRPPRAVAGRRARAAALAGRLDEALRHADQIIADPAAPDHEHAVRAEATVLAHRGLLVRSAALHRSLRPSLAVLAVPALVATGAIEEARAALVGARAEPGRTLLEGAAALTAQGMIATVGGSPRAALSALSRATMLLEPVGATALLPDSPAALAAIVAGQCGELSVAESALRRAVDSRQGGRPARIRHHLLHAWLRMSQGAFDRARRELDRVAGPEGRLEPRDEFLAAALAVALARRSDGASALAATWSRARDALLQYPVDLTTLPQLGELLVATAQLGEQDWLDPHLEEADRLLDDLGRPALWAAPLHWFRVQAALATDRPADVDRHRTALAEAAATGPYAAVLDSAVATWMQLAAGSVDAEAVLRVGRRMHAVGLGWEAARLAGRAAPLAGDKRTTAGLHAFARALHGSGTDAPRPAVDGSPEPDGVGPHPDGFDAADPAPDGRSTEEGPTDGGRPDGLIDAGPADRRTDAGLRDAGAGAATTEVPAPRQPPAGDEGVGLSERELEIGRFILAGLTYKQIGERLFISAKTVEHHVARMRQRLGVTSRGALFDQLRSALDPDGERGPG